MGLMYLIFLNRITLFKKLIAGSLYIIVIRSNLSNIYIIYFGLTKWLEIQFNLKNVYHEVDLHVTIKDEIEPLITKIESLQSWLTEIFRMVAKNT